MGTEQHACCAMCAGASLDDVMRQAAGHVRRLGWSATGTVTRGGVPYTYTVGLPHSLGHPEFLVAGLPPQAAHGVIEAAIGKVRESGPLEDGSLHEGVIVGYPVKVRKGPVFSPFRLGMANRFAGRAVPWVQVIWPDAERRFPGDPGCDPAMAAAQEGRPS